jgi:predicted aminopeptidase
MPATRPSTRRHRAWRGLAVAAALLAVAACSPGYLSQAALGQWQVLRARRPLEQVLADPATDPALRGRLLAADGALVFARTTLALPRTRSYRHYADLGRAYVVWNVFTAPEFDLAPTEYCFPVAGCVPYRGFFAEAAAAAEARRLAAGGADVFVGGVAAYATLGWFDDPLLNTLLDAAEADVAATLFHELAHQQYYLPGDTPFNEGYASFVEQAGLRQWLAFRGDAAGLCAVAGRERRRRDVDAILDGLRAELGAAYAAGGDTAARRAAKAAAIGRARDRYRALRAGWDGPPWFDGWFGLGPDGEPLAAGSGAGLPNNASLAALASYGQWVPAFAALHAEVGGDWPAFYAGVARLGALPDAERAARLTALAAAGTALSAGPGAGSCRSS